MIPDLGHVALLLALLFSAAQSVVPLWGAAVGNGGLMRLGNAFAVLQFAAITVSFFALMVSYVTSDFSVLNVVQNSHTDKPMIYKIAGVWGNHEGSMLLWMLMLSLYGALVAAFGRTLPEPLRARALAVQGMLSVGFLLFVIFTSNPFARIFPVPENGMGLNPILQDPGLAMHPPCLYLGYVGFSMVFSFAVAALLDGRVDAAWARHVRPWVLTAWAFLTAGIGLGSWWAYYTLGWGGWWFWDPVENASFMPWLVGTALVHAIIVLEKRDTLQGWTVLLAIVTFSFSLLGTFLVRSGVLTSVHSFAVDPSRGVFILALFVLYTGAGFLLYALQSHRFVRGPSFGLLSREGSILVNNLILSVSAGTVLLGTLYPLLMDVAGGDQISVGPPYFNLTFIPLMVPLIVLMAAAPHLPWQRAKLSKLRQSLTLSLLVAIFSALVCFAAKPQSVGAAAAVGLAVWLVAGTLAAVIARVRHHPRSLSPAFWGMATAHLGLAVLMLGIIGSTAWKTEKIQVMRVGQTVNVAGYDLTLRAVHENVPGPNFVAEQGEFHVSKNGQPIATLRPEKRTYAAPSITTTHAAIHTHFWGDLYAVVGDGDGRGAYITRLYDNPLVPWIFVGAGIMALGGALSLLGRRNGQTS